jgi:very-short-patch-repair endonuclease
MRGDKSQYKYALARQFRRALTPPETRLWARLKGKMDGLHFRKQHPIGPYIVDFYCPKANLIIEVDGIIHDIADVAARDDRRSQWLSSFDLEILRVVASEVMADPDDVALGIIDHARSRLRK